MNKVNLIRRFASEIAGEHVYIERARSEWKSCMYDNKMRIGLPVDLMANDALDKLFRKNFVQRCPLAQGFSNVTLSLLHELGHQFHREEYIFFDAVVYNNTFGEAYFNLPPEKVATDWAIAWLQVPENRKLAKKFEREFFGYGSN